MINYNEHDLFTGREEAICLFEEQIDEHNTATSWPLLPVLSLVGPAGYGKSRFMRQLYFYHCQTHPHASLDFNRPGPPRDLLNIFGTLRNDLRRQQDEQGHALKFPRFTIIYTLLKKTEGQSAEEKDEIGELPDAFSDLIGLLGNLYFVLGLFLVVLKLIAQIPFIRALIRQLVAWGYERAGGRPEWHWYQDQVKKFREFNLPDKAPLPISTILSRLNEMCLGAPEREFLIEQILPKAFLADLRYGSYDQEPWNRTDPAKREQGARRVVIFLDSFEILIRDAEPVAKHLLKALAFNEYRRRGDSDPLLLVISSEELLPDMLPAQLSQHFPLGSETDTRTMQERADDLFDAWQQQVSPQSGRRVLSMGNIYLPLPLSTFSLDATREYLLKLDRQDETDCFTDEALIEDIHRETQGYPVFLERMAAALQTSSVRNIEQLFAPGGQGGQIVDRLVATHCTPVEERELMLMAIPRTLTQELLALILNLSAADAQGKWQHYRHQPFLLLSGDQQRITFLPGIRALFLKKLQLTTPNSNNTDYDRTHRLLSNYFNDLIKREGAHDERNLLEYSYHSLALGDHEAVIPLASTQRRQPERWLHLLKVIEQSPTQRLPRAMIEQEAEDALDQARSDTNAKAAVRAIVLYTWLLAAPGSEPSLWLKLAAAHNYLHKADVGTRSNMAAYCDQRAKDLRTEPQFLYLSRTPTEPRRAVSQPPLPRPPLKQRVWGFSRGLYRGVLSSRGAQLSLAVVLIITVVLFLILPYLSLARPQQPSVPIATDNPFALPLTELQPSSQNHWIGATIQPDKEFIGLSDGSIPFDYLRPDASLKKQAAAELRRGYLGTARDLFMQAVQSDINDAEAFIYLENTQIHLSGKTCTVFVVATGISEDGGEGVNNGRDNLQGAYVAQKQHNDSQQGTPICLYIANVGTDPGYVPIVAQQIVKAIGANNTIKGLMGWPGLFASPASLDAVNQLQAAQIPIVSPDGYDEAQYAPNVFHIAPSYQDEGRRAALYAEKMAATTHAFVISDPTDPYSRGLTEGFKERFEEDKNQIVGVQPYRTGHSDAQTFANLRSLLEATRPDFIYFAGGIVEGQMLLVQLRADSSAVPIFGGDGLYPFVGFSENTRSDFQRLAFTSSAYPDTPTALQMKGQYALAFDSRDQGGVRGYGYSRPDDRAILSYDTMETLITAYDASGVQSLQQALSSVSFKGASRELITFTPINELSDQRLLMLSVNQQQQINFTVV